MKQILLLILCLSLLLTAGCAQAAPAEPAVVPTEIAARLTGMQNAAELKGLLTDGMKAISSTATYAQPTWDMVLDACTHCVRGTVAGIGESRIGADGMIETDVYFRVDEYLAGEPAGEYLRIRRPFGKVDDTVRLLDVARHDLCVGDEYIAFLVVQTESGDPVPAATLYSEFALFAPDGDGRWTGVHPAEDFGTFTAEELAEKAR